MTSRKRDRAVKPVKAWALVCDDGSMLRCFGGPMVFYDLVDADRWLIENQIGSYRPTPVLITPLKRGKP